MFQDFQKLNRGVSTPVAILVIVAVSVVSAGLVLWQYLEIQRETANDSSSGIQFSKPNLATSTESTESTEDATQSSDTEIDTSSWAIYSNKELGFEFEYPREVVGDIEKSGFSKNNSSLISSGEKIELNFTKKLGIIFFARTLDFEYNIPPSSSFVKNDSDIKCQQSFTLISGENPYCDYTMCKLMEIAGEKAIFEVCASNYECACDTFASIYLINPTDSKYKSLEFRIYLEDTEKKICSGFSCLEKINTSIIDFWCKNLLLGRGFSAEDEKRLNLFSDIISTFRLIEE